MKNKNKKGFTLIEVSTILLIMAVIMAIAIPSVLFLTEKMKKNSFEKSLILIEKTSEIKYSSLTIKKDLEYNFDKNENNGFQTNSDILNIKGEKPSKGQVRIDKNGEISYALLSNDESFCGIKEKNDNLIVKKVESEEDKKNCVLNINNYDPSDPQIIFDLSDPNKWTKSKNVKMSSSIELKNDEYIEYIYVPKGKILDLETWVKYEKPIANIKQNGIMYARLIRNGVVSIESTLNVNKIDSIEPTCELSFLNLDGLKPNINGWLNQNFTVYMSYKDKGGSGVTSSGIYDINNTFIKSNTLTVTKDGKGDLIGTVTDGAGNKGTCKLPYAKDSTGPTCDLLVTGDKGNNNWYKGNVNVAINNTKANEDLSGIDSKMLKINNKELLSDNVDITNDTLGDIVVAELSDKAGNKSTCNVTVKKDATPPECVLSKSGTKGDNDWYRSNVTVGWTKAEDKFSGLNTQSMSATGYRYSSSKKNLIITNDTTKTGLKVTGTVTDKAGNTGNCYELVYKDTKPPICNLKPSGTLGTENWYRSNITVAWDSSTDDKLSGIKTQTMSASGYTYDTTNKNLIVNKDTTTAGLKVTGTVTDKAGNSRTCTYTALRDTTPPECELYQSGTAAGKEGWYRSDITIGFKSVGDALSKLASQKITASGYTYNTTKKTVVINKDTSSSGLAVTGTVTDKAGNTKNCNKTPKRDTVAPNKSTIIASGTKGDNGWYTSDVTVKITQGTDALSGEDHVTYSLSGATTLAETTIANNGTFKITADGTTTVKSYTYDKAGNISTVETLEVKKDAKKPDAPALLEGYQWHGGGHFVLGYIDQFESTSWDYVSGVEILKTKNSTPCYTISPGYQCDKVTTCSSKYTDLRLTGISGMAGNFLNYSKTSTVTASHGNGTKYSGEVSTSVAKGNSRNLLKFKKAGDYTRLKYCVGNSKGLTMQFQYGYIIADLNQISYSGGDVAIFLSNNDTTGSKFARYEYQIENGDWIKISDTWDGYGWYHTNSGSLSGKKFKFRVVDKAGNKSESKSVTIKVYSHHNSK